MRSQMGNLKEEDLKKLEILNNMIDDISCDLDFWKSTVGSYAKYRGETRPDGVNQIDAEKTIVDLASRLKTIGLDAKYKCSGNSIIEWFNSFFRSRHPATEEYYRILSKLSHFIPKNISEVTKDLIEFKEKYGLKSNNNKEHELEEKKKALIILIDNILCDRIGSIQTPGLDEIRNGIFESRNNHINNVDYALKNAYSIAKKYYSLPWHYFFSNPLTFLEIRKVYGILNELEVLDKYTIEKVTEKLKQFKGAGIKPTSEYKK